MSRSEKLERALRLCMERMCKCCLAEAQHKSTKLKAVCENGCETLRIAKEALEEPPRNCDVGTYEKYRIEHADGTPLKGKSYFVLRLDSDNPAEAARVAAAMRAYKGRLRNGDVGTPAEQSARYEKFCFTHRTVERCCEDCPLKSEPCCELAWAQLPYEEAANADADA